MSDTPPRNRPGATPPVMSLEGWDELRTAYHVARTGTVSGAAESLGVHHATVIRHVDALEKRLGARLFQRHARGYTPTEAGMDLMQVGRTTEDQFAQLASRIRGRGEGVSGDLTITSLSVMSPLITPLLVEFGALYPAVEVRFLTDERVFRLEYGEAHVAIRAGRQPQEPDNVVQRLFRYDIGFYATREYLEGRPAFDGENWDKHRFVGVDTRLLRAPFYGWLQNEAPPESIAFRTSSQRANIDAVLAGAGIGFLPRWLGERHDDVVEVMPPREDWSFDLWLVTHVDLHRTAKVQAVVQFLKERFAELGL